MSNENPNLDIQATLDATSVTQNAQPAANALREIAAAEKDVGAAAETTAEETEKLTAAIQAQRSQMMQNIFQAHRLMEGFKDLSEGGRLASQGMVDLEETLGRFLPPQAQVVLAIASAVGLLTMMATRHRGAAGEAREHANAEKEAAEAIDKATTSIIKFAEETAKVHLSVQTAELKDFLTVQKELIDQQERYNSNADKRATYLQNETEAQQKLTLAQLENAKQQELHGATTDAQRETIEARYKVRELGVNGANEQEKIAASQAELAAEKKENDQLRAQLLDANNQNDAALNELKAKVDATASKAREDGFSADEAGSFEANRAGQEARVKAATEAYAKVSELNFADRVAAVHIANGTASPFETAHAAAREQQIRSAQQNMTQESSKLADITDANSAREAFQKGQSDLATASKANTEAINKLVEKLDEMASKGRVLGIDAQAAALSTSTSIEAVGDTETVKKSKEAARAKQQLDAAQNRLTDAEGAEQRGAESETIRQLRSHLEELKKQLSEKTKHHSPLVALMGQIAQAQHDLAAATTTAMLEQTKHIEEVAKRAQDAVDKLKNSTLNNAAGAAQ